VKLSIKPENSMGRTRPKSDSEDRTDRHSHRSSGLTVVSLATTDRARHERYVHAGDGRRGADMSHIYNLKRVELM